MNPPAFERSGLVEKVDSSSETVHAIRKSGKAIQKNDTEREITWFKEGSQVNDFENGRSSASRRSRLDSGSDPGLPGDLDVPDSHKIELEKGNVNPKSDLICTPGILSIDIQMATSSAQSRRRTWGCTRRLRDGRVCVQVGRCAFARTSAIGRGRGRVHFAPRSGGNGWAVFAEPPFDSESENDSNGGHTRPNKFADRCFTRGEEMAAADAATGSSKDANIEKACLLGLSPAHVGLSQLYINKTLLKPGLSRLSQE
ncbi:hypothetical protein B0H11DRAFT_1898530 [Mycena galericulata]|nr:hypothetical protein B0H11DRAFT_1898530 [Mycena galericulata]